MFVLAYSHIETKKRVQNVFEQVIKNDYAYNNLKEYQKPTTKRIGGAIQGRRRVKSSPFSLSQRS